MELEGSKIRVLFSLALRFSIFAVDYQVMSLILDFSFEQKHILFIDLDCIHFLVEREDFDTMRIIVKALVSLKTPLSLTNAEKREITI